MPWKDRSAMDLRKQFAIRAFESGVPFTELCAEFGISRKTGYKWKQRLLEQGYRGLTELSRRPAASPNELTESVVCEIVRLKNAHRHWGARKLQRLYERLHGGQDLPSESSFKRVLDRAGLVEHRVARPANQSGRLKALRTACSPNDLWTVDFKGWWYTPGQRRCQPLTVRDAYSRYILALRVPPDSGTETVREEFERLFQCYGLPAAIRSDNGPPFATWHSLLGLSQLSVWWVALGIDLDRIDPGHPEQNGSHERMHRDIANEVQGQVCGELKEQAAALEIWRQEYNQERPHEALGMRTPGELYAKSLRAYSGTPDHLQYPADYLQRQVNAAGQFKLCNATLRLSSALSGWNVGLKPVSEVAYAVYFGRLLLGRADLSTQSFLAAPGPVGALPQTPGFSASSATDGRSGGEVLEGPRPAVQ